MTLRLNGETTEARGASTIAELIERYGLPAEAILIEHNGLALHRREWIEHRLSEGDCVEVLRVVAGG